jgi:tRNA pseudouridine55 synthase
MNPSQILLIDKPVGITSFDVIRRLRRKLNIKKMGHAGTLDPLASGLMIIGVNEGTKKLQEYLKRDKEYETEVLIGRRTATGDMEGEVVEEKAVDAEAAVEIFSAEKISTALASMVGTLTLPVSAYSAIKKDGVPFYKKARQLERLGQSVPASELPVRDMKVFKAELVSTTIYDSANKRVIVPVRFKVGSGTYIRSLGEELGRRLDYPATLKSLRRTKIGEFDIRDAIDLVA